MIKISDILVDDKICKTNFACDLQKCKGACCTFPGELGAPLLDEEIELMKANFKVAIKYINDKSRKYIEEHGFVEGSVGDYSTVCIDNRDCVFVFFEEDIAYCAYERAFLNGESDFQKPVSCHLFPVRVGNFGGKAIYYERIKECKPAITNGRKHNIKMYENVKDALIRRFGEDFYNQLVKHSKA